MYALSEIGFYVVSQCEERFERFIKKEMEQIRPVD